MRVLRAPQAAEEVEAHMLGSAMETPPKGQQAAGCSRMDRPLKTRTQLLVLELALKMRIQLLVSELALKTCTQPLLLLELAASCCSCCCCSLLQAREDAVRQRQGRFGVVAVMTSPAFAAKQRSSAQHVTINESLSSRIHGSTLLSSRPALHRFLGYHAAPSERGALALHWMPSSKAASP